MKVAVGNDHRGLPVKQRVLALLAEHGCEVLDLGTNSPSSSDFADYALPVAEAVAAGKVKTGVLLCATGHGMCIAANKVAGVRAANCRDMLDAELSRRHNDANVMCLGADLIGEEQLDRIIRVWLNTAFDGGRHIRRREKVTDYEKAKACGS